MQHDLLYLLTKQVCMCHDDGNAMCDMLHGLQHLCKTLTSNQTAPVVRLAGIPNFQSCKMTQLAVKLLHLPCEG